MVTTILIGCALFIAFVLGTAFGSKLQRRIDEKERPSQIEWKLSEGAGPMAGTRAQTASSENVYDWAADTYIRPPTGPDLLVLDLQERTRL
jgi:hypothetical protein